MAAPCTPSSRASSRPRRRAAGAMTRCQLRRPALGRPSRSLATSEAPPTLCLHPFRALRVCTSSCQRPQTWHTRTASSSRSWCRRPLWGRQLLTLMAAAPSTSPSFSSIKISWRISVYNVCLSPIISLLSHSLSHLISLLSCLAFLSLSWNPPLLECA